jgi:hypothetical protein
MPHMDDINDPVLAGLAQEYEDSIGSGWKLGEPPDDGKPCETRIAPAGALWHRPMRLSDSLPNPTESIDPDTPSLTKYCCREMYFHGQVMWVHPANASSDQGSSDSQLS